MTDGPAMVDSTPLPYDCYELPEGMLFEADALRLVRDRIGPVAANGEATLSDAVGHYLAEKIVSPRNVPHHHNSAVDGYAFAATDLGQANEGLTVIGEARPGQPFEGKAKAGQTVRIFTGAVIPAGTDTVMMQEDATVASASGATIVKFNVDLKKGANRRQAGEDIAKGKPLLDAGRLLGPAELASLASIGLDRLKIFSPLKVALLSTGNELLEPGSDFRSGHVYDSNKIMLRALLDSYPIEVTDLGIVDDNRASVVDMLASAAAQHDVVLTSGGASTGEGDHIVDAVSELGAVHFWRIAVKPGRPLALGQIGNCSVVGLPGNPVAVFVCFLIYVRPLLTRLGGGAWTEPRAFPLPAAFELPRKKVNRREYLRGVLQASEQSVHADKFAHDGSGLIASLRSSDGLIRLPEELAAVVPGQPVDFIPYSELGIRR